MEELSSELPWCKAARQIEDNVAHDTEVIRCACEQWARLACENWRQVDAARRKAYSALEAQLTCTRAVLEECRPMVKARLAMDYDKGNVPVDHSILTRIEAALAGAPVPDELAATKARLEMARTALRKLVVGWRKESVTDCDITYGERLSCARGLEESLAALDTPAADTGGKEATP